jgi:hypothetical protein
MSDTPNKQTSPVISDDHAILGTTTEAGGDRLAESLARIGVLLDCHRVELFRQIDGSYQVVGWWTALGHAAPEHGLEPVSLPAGWFPWNLGNVRPTESLFVRNAGSLPTRPSGGGRIRQLGMGSSLCLPLSDGPGGVDEALGALCVYWADERAEWPDDLAEAAKDLGRDALLDS